MTWTDATVYATRTLRTRGLTRAALDAALRRGDLTRVRRGWYAAPGADPALVAAVRAGGRLSCVTLLRRRGVWALDDGMVHVRVPKGRDVRGASGVRLHWTQDRLELERAWDDPADALACAVGCLDLRHAIAVTDSVLNMGLVSIEEVTRRLAGRARGRAVLARCDPQAESGLETFARLALVSARIRVRSQVVIAGVGRVDLVVGDRLVIELDGAAWHGGTADFERDRLRDRALMARGYLVMRATYHQVLFELPTLVAQVQEVVRRREHIWQLTQRRAAELGQQRALARL
jgi:very-short-patch-repair endonuclease